MLLLEDEEELTRSPPGELELEKAGVEKGSMRLFAAEKVTTSASVQQSRLVHVLPDAVYSSTRMSG